MRNNPIVVSGYAIAMANRPNKTEQMNRLAQSLGFTKAIRYDKDKSWLMGDQPIGETYREAKQYLAAQKSDRGRSAIAGAASGEPQEQI